MAEVIKSSVPGHLTQRIRSACDRCHSQKLRCRKLPGNGQCARCAKVAAPCVFSPANRGFRSNPTAATSCAAQNGENDVNVAASSPSAGDLENSTHNQDAENFPLGANQQDGYVDGANVDENNYTDIVDVDVENNAVDMFMQLEAWNADDPPTFLPDMNDFNIENLDFSLVEDIAQLNAAPFCPEVQPASSITPFIAGGLYIQRLSSLTINLYEHASLLSPPPRSNEYSREYKGGRCTSDAKEFPIDKVFQWGEEINVGC